MTVFDLTAARQRNQGRPPLPPCEGCGGPSVESDGEGNHCCQVCINGILAAGAGQEYSEWTEWDPTGDGSWQRVDFIEYRSANAALIRLPDGEKRLVPSVQLRLMADLRFIEEDAKEKIP